MPSGQAPHPARGILLVVLATLLFASHDALAKYLSGFYPVILVVWVRYVVHSLLMAGIFLPRAGLRMLRTRRPGLQLLRAICLLGTSLLFVSSLQFIPLAAATAVNFLAPVLVTALSVPLLGERVSMGQWVAVSLGFFGVLVIVHPGGELFTPAILLPLGSALCFALYQLLTRKLSEFDGPSTSNLLAGLFATVVLSTLMPLFWQPLALQHLPLLLALGVLGMLAHLLLTQSFRHAPPALLAPFGYCQIIFAGALGLLLFDSRPDRSVLLGTALICLGGLAAAWLQRRASR
ncbi:MAG: EamA family transporter [Pseudomonas sp.]|jgi:drug/metabolite transporter (DMT)-like permease|nr:EamA family transporter [Pseudomonadales bacterium]MAK87982.1 EamA family transporter [Pseudomonas sp.]|tara:strand:- start:7437 stop:8309 length:873 start_codon:yes stop_codon:yes gene_type:complete